MDENKKKTKAKKTLSKKDNEAADEKKIIEKTTRELFDYLQIEGDFEYTVDDNNIDINLATEDNGLIIGYHGEILESLQLILSLCISKKIGRFIRVSIEVGEYKKNRRNYLENLALSAKEKALADNSEVSLSSLKSWERRIIHLFLESDPQVASESRGEGRERVLVIRPR